MIEKLGSNPTQVTGIIVFIAAAAACLLARAPNPRSNTLSIWHGLSLIYGLLALEIVFGMRHKVHGLVNAQLQAAGEYASRNGPQKILIAIASAAIIIAFVLFMRRLRGARSLEKLAVGVTIGLLALFIFELISLHAIDAVLYHLVGPVMLIGWLWAAASGAIAILAFRQRWEQP